jgi:heme-degrading monooxygenase HmoA
MVTEMLIYKINDQALENFDQLSEEKTLFLANQEGFIKRKVLQDTTLKSFFIDLVEWNSEENAINAQDLLKKEDKIKKLNDVIDVFYSTTLLTNYQEQPVLA